MRTLRAIDSLAYGILFAGAINSIINQTRKAKTRSNILGKNSKPSMGASLYAASITLASAYKLMRIIGPKTKEEQRLIKAARLYDKAIVYKHRSKLYRRAAEVFFKRRFNNFKTATSS